MTSIHDATAPLDTGCAVKPVNLPRPKPITVNGVTIPRNAISRETQNHPASKPIDAWMAAARALVVRELLLQEARQQAIEPDAITDDEGRRETDEEALVRQLVERDVRTPDADDATCLRVYEQNRQRFRSADLFGVRHILIAAPPADADARASARRLAETIIAAVATDPATFSAHAEATSACPSRAMGGILGQVSRGQTVPEFEQALAKAPVGSVCPTPVETRYGVHVVFVDQRIDGETLPFSVVRSRIAEWLASRAEHASIHQYIAMLAAKADIKGIELASH
ncbi:MAG: peptidylprolyl isomerase [Hyphomicrobium sp.]|nr:MAG: peptidylprolyl isomerase [Hyphomicrobium sp.]